MDKDQIGVKTKQEQRRLVWLQMKQNKEAYLMMLPFMLVFLVFTIIPVIMSLPIGLTDFDMVQYPPAYVGLSNFYNLFLNDSIFIKSIRVTLVFAVFTGPLSYFLSFLLAWLINELNQTLKVIFTLIFYAPSMASGVYAVWQLIFSGDSYGYINSLLLSLGIITEPIIWLKNATFLMPIIIMVQLWQSMGISFLSNISGLQNVNGELYEAGAIDGIRNRWQELRYITLPSMHHMLLFSAVMQIQSSFSVSAIAIEFAGYPSVENSVDTIVSYLSDVATVRFEMGYAAAISVVLFIMMALTRAAVGKILGMSNG